jgi:hypothetical protein
MTVDRFVKAGVTDADVAEDDIAVEVQETVEERPVRDVAPSRLGQRGVGDAGTSRP